MAQEFLPFCDVLFNIISLASYFCDVVFDVVTVYTLFVHHETTWFALALSFILLSLILCQLMSVRWYFRKKRVKVDFKVFFIGIIHVLQCGVLWRYFKLFIPVDLARVKIEVRDLCMLRLIHAFCEAAPMLLIQLYLIWLKSGLFSLSDLNIVSTALSIFSVCWALASFTKNVRRRNIHRLVLTWLGVIFQFLWHLGTIASRVTALTVYATLYHYWVFVVIGLHWISMLLWLMSPKNVFHGESIFWMKRTGFCMLIAYVYIFCYVNLQEFNPRLKMIAFYITMFLENTLLMAVWLALRVGTDWFHYPVVVIVWGGFILGILFMALYYKFFHIRHLKQSLAVASMHGSHSECAACPPGSCVDHSVRTSTYFLSETSTNEYSNGSFGVTYKPQNSAIFHSVNGSFSNGMVNNIPGVFNCRLNPALKRKKKKPSSFIPPPVPVTSLSNGKMSNPFWKRSLPRPTGSDHESSVGSRVNIQQKLQEKKQQQLQELKEIEEEIKQGKIKRPHPLDTSEQGTLRQPIPHSKKQPWMRPELPTEMPIHFQYPSLIGPSGMLGIRPKAKNRSQTPEILLSPHYLENSRIYYDYHEPRGSFSVVPNLNLQHTSDLSSNSNASGISRNKHQSNKKEHRDRCSAMYKSYRIPSDLDSQISLPRSYTLPREFRYYRRPKIRKSVRTDQFFVFNNSSDGDVDSGDDNDTDVLPASRPVTHIRTRQHPLHLRNVGVRQHHETKL